MSYHFGEKRRRALAAAKSLGSVSEEALPELLERALGYSSFDDTILSQLEERVLSSAAAQEVSRVLGSKSTWHLDQLRRIAVWLDRFSKDASRSWLQSLVPYPPAGSSCELALRFTSVTNGALSPSRLCAAPRASRVLRRLDQNERFAVARLMLTTESEQTATDLLEAAVVAGADSTIAALFESGLLDGQVANQQVLDAFHRLEWDRWGTAKRGFLLQARRLGSERPLSRSERRFAALVSLEAGDVPKALAELEALLPAQDQESGLPGEAFLALVLAGTRPSRTLRELLKVWLEGQGEQEPERWLALLAGREGRGQVAPERLRQLVEGMALPRPGSPLFPPVATFLLRQCFLQANAQEIWPIVENRLATVDRLWFWRLSAEHREYFIAVRGLMSARTDAKILAIHLQRLLLLPVDLRWASNVLRLMTSDFRGDLMVDAEGDPTRLGTLLIDVSIRIVAELEERGHTFSASAAQNLRSADPRRIATTLLNLLIDEDFQNQPRVGMQA